MLKMLLQFVISGTIVVVATAVGQKVSQKWAGLIVALPLWTILVYVFLLLNNKTANHHEYLLSALVFMIPAAIFLTSLLALHRFNAYAGLAGGAILYAISALLVNKLM